MKGGCFINVGSEMVMIGLSFASNAMLRVALRYVTSTYFRYTTLRCIVWDLVSMYASAGVCLVVV